MGRTPKKLPEAIKFGQNVRKRRVALGYSQEGLAERVGVHFTYLSSVERGERNVSLHNIVRLARALDMDPGDLVRGLRPGPS